MLLFHCFMILVLVSVLVFVWHFLEFSNISESVTRSVLCNCSCCGCWAMLNPQSSIIVVAQNTKPWLAINTWATKHKATRYMQQSRGFCAWKKYTTLTGHNRTCRKQSDFSVDHQHVFQYTRAMLDDLWRMSCVTNPHNTLPGPKYTRSKISLNWWAVTGESCSSECHSPWQSPRPIFGGGCSQIFHAFRSFSNLDGIQVEHSGT